MYVNPEAMDYKQLTATGTGSGVQAPEARILACPIGDCVVKVAVSPTTNSFLGIVEVIARNDFRSPSKRFEASAFHDVEAFYKE